MGARTIPPLFVFYNILFLAGHRRVYTLRHYIYICGVNRFETASLTINKIDQPLGVPTHELPYARCLQRCSFPGPRVKSRYRHHRLPWVMGHLTLNSCTSGIACHTGLYFKYH